MHVSSQLEKYIYNPICSCQNAKGKIKMKLTPMLLLLESCCFGCFCCFCCCFWIYHRFSSEATAPAAAPAAASMSEEKNFWTMTMISFLVSVNLLLQGGASQQFSSEVLIDSTASRALRLSTKSLQDFQFLTFLTILETVIPEERAEEQVKLL